MSSHGVSTFDDARGNREKLLVIWMKHFCHDTGISREQFGERVKICNVTFTWLWVLKRCILKIRTIPVLVGVRRGTKLIMLFKIFLLTLFIHQSFAEELRSQRDIEPRQYNSEIDFLDNKEDKRAAKSRLTGWNTYKGFSYNSYLTLNYMSKHIL